MFASFPESIFFGEGHGSLAIFVDCCGAMLDEAEFLAEFTEENCFLRGSAKGDKLCLSSIEYLEGCTA